MDKDGTQWHRRAIVVQSKGWICNKSVVFDAKNCKNLSCVNRIKVLESVTPFGDAVQMVRRNLVSIACRVLGILGQSRDRKFIEKFFTNQKLPLHNSQIQGDLLILTPSKTFSQTR